MLFRHMGDFQVTGTLWSQAAWTREVLLFYPLHVVFL